MSDFATIAEIQLKADMFRPVVLDAFRRGNLTYHDMSTLGPPINEVYRNTYQYIQTPAYPSPAALHLVSQALLKPVSMPTAASMSYAQRSTAIQNMLQYSAAPDSTLTARPFPLQIGRSR